MKPKKVLTLVALVFLILFGYYAIEAAPLISDSEYTYLSGMQWYNTYEAGAAAALEEDKPIFLYFWTFWCVWCEKLQTEVYPQEEISRVLQEDYILVAIDMDINKEDTQRFNVVYPPQEKFLTPDGKVIHTIPGYVPADQLLSILKEIRDNYRGREHT
jgi:thioredoxin-related protein